LPTLVPLKGSGTINVGVIKGGTKINIVPVAFGLKAIDFLFVMDEKMGDTEPLEAQLREIEGINSVETTDVRRAVG
jgi:translation elongation factor aEF-1 beta